MIKHRGVIHNIMNDAPFIGAVIIAPFCFNNCINCHNQHLKKEKLIKENADTVINKIFYNKFDEGVIFSGLEWFYDQKYLLKLLKSAKFRHLKTMLYTSKELEDIPLEIKHYCDYIKTGKYIPELKVEDNIQYGVKLVTSNQQIYKRGDDY